MKPRFHQDLHTAAAQGELDVVQLLLNEGEEVDRLNVDGQTALYCAAAKRRRHVVQFLLQSGADPDGLVPPRPPRTINSRDEQAELDEEDDGDGDDCDDEEEELEEDEEDDDEADWLDEEEADDWDEDTNGDTPLLAACEDGDHESEMLEVISLLLAAGANVDTAGESGLTPLMKVIWRECPKVFDALLAAGAEVNAVDDERQTALLAALSIDDNPKVVSHMVRALLAAGANIHHADEEGQTPLMLAAAFGHVDIVRTFLEMGADVDTEDEEERTALVRAAETLANLSEIGTDAGFDPDEILAGLEELGIDPASPQGKQLFESMHNRHGPGSPTWTMAGIESQDQLDALKQSAVPKLREIIALLVDRGCRIEPAASYLLKAGLGDLVPSGTGLDTPNALGQTALTDAIAEGRVDRVRELLELGADPNAVNDFGQSLIECVPVTRRGRECGRLLIDAGANPNARSSNGVTVLEIAVESQDFDKVQLLMDWGADVGLGEPVLWAVRAGNLALAKLLLERGADPNATLDADGQFSFAGFLAGTTPLMRAAADQPLEMLELLVAAGADPRAQDREGRSAVDVAVRSGRDDVARWLLERGGQAPDQQSYSLGLLAAAERGELEQVQAMLEQGADPKVLGDSGITSLILAAREGHQAVVEMLLNAGANVNVCSDPGYSGGNSTALRCAVVRGHTAIVRCLLEAGADTRPNYEYSSIPAEGNNSVIGSIGTALHDAACGGDDEMVDLLLAAGADVHAVDQKDETPLVVAVRNHHWPIARSLLIAGAERRDQDACYLAPLDFAATAAQPEFSESIRLVESLVGTTPQSSDSPPGLVVFTVLPDDPEPTREGEREYWKKYFEFRHSLDEKMWKLLDAAYDHCLARGHLLLHYSGFPSCGKSEQRYIHLLPTTDNYAALALYNVRGNEVELTTGDIIAWLRKFEQDYPFRLRGVGFDVVEMEFSNPLADPESVTQQLAKFCPDLIDQNFSSLGALTQHLAKTHRVHLWWD